MNAKIKELMTQQIKYEFESSYLYLSMAVWFHSQNLDGMAQWMRTQAHEEWTHGMKFVDHLLERGEQVKLLDLKQEKTAWTSPLEAWEETCVHEQLVTSKITDLMSAVREQKDYASEGLVAWFVSEQVEEEANASKIRDMVKLVADSPNGLFMLDGKLGGRPFPTASPFAPAGR